MGPDLEAKTDQYESLLQEAVDAVAVAPPAESPLGTSAETCRTMAESYLTDGRHFRDQGELPDALAAFAYGHAWLDAGARIGLFEVPTDGDLFTV